MKFRIRKIGIDTYKEAVAYIRKENLLIPSLGLHLFEKTRIWKGKNEILATLHSVDGIIEIDEVGLSKYAFEKLGLKEGDYVYLEPSPPIRSVEFVKKRLSGERFTEEEVKELTRDISRGRYSPAELSTFITSVHLNPFSDDELYWFIKAMVNNGKKLKHDVSPVLDKHCIGGVPGNRTSMIIVPIIASLGLRIPKTSSRAITSPAGTADTMEVLAEVEKTSEQIMKILKKENGCIVWGGYVQLAPADDIIISVERPLSLDVQSLMISSILAKKIAAGSEYVIIDIPVGKWTKVKSIGDGLVLKRKLKKIANKFGIQCEVVFTDGNAPVGKGVGPVYEAMDVLSVLKNENPPLDLKEKSIMLAGTLLEMCGYAKKGEGKEIAKKELESGRAYEKFERIRIAQGKKNTSLKKGFGLEIKAKDDGVIKEINVSAIAKMAKYAGAPKDIYGGAEIFAKIGEKVKRGDLLGVFYSSNKTALEFVKKAVKTTEIFKIRS